MSTDLEQIEKALPAIIKSQIDSPSGDTEMYFDDIHFITIESTKKRSRI